MPRTVSNHNGKFSAILKEYGVKVEDPFGLEAALFNLYHPVPDYPPNELLMAAWEKLTAYVDSVENGSALDRAGYMKIMGLEIGKRTHTTAANKMLAENKLLQHRPSEPEVWVKQITAQ